MTRDILLLVLSLSGESHETRFTTEWACLQAAKAHNERGEQAFCVIKMPDDMNERLEKYPDNGWSKEMLERLEDIR